MTKLANNTEIFKGEMDNENDVTAKLIELSKQYPDNLIAAMITFNTVIVMAFSSNATVPIDGPTSRTMKDWYNGLGFKNGELVQPSNGWQRRSAEHSYRVYSG